MIVRNTSVKLRTTVLPSSEVSSAEAKERVDEFLDMPAIVAASVTEVEYDPDKGLVAGIRISGFTIPEAVDGSGFTAHSEAILTQLRGLLRSDVFRHFEDVELLCQRLRSLADEAEDMPLEKSGD